MGVCSRKSAKSKAPFRNPPLRNPRNPWLLARQKPAFIENARIASGGRTWKCAGPGMASPLISETLD
eukprot:15456747-Alexandrium_andersonii.AAC.1